MWAKIDMKNTGRSWGVGVGGKLNIYLSVQLHFRNSHLIMYPDIVIVVP